MLGGEILMGRKNESRLGESQYLIFSLKIFESELLFVFHRSTKVVRVKKIQETRNKKQHEFSGNALSRHNTQIFQGKRKKSPNSIFTGN